MMSLPALPWLFNKHLLRRSMADKLPTEVLRRPKTPLGHIHESLLKKNVLGKLRPVAATVQYINQNRIHSLSTTTESGAESYVNLRPLVLNTWLAALHL